MGKVKVDDESVVSPDRKVPAGELKERAEVPANHRLYDTEGDVYDDDELVDTDEEDELGVIEPWERGR
jgi:hypothetical protein